MASTRVLPLCDLGHGFSPGRQASCWVGLLWQQVLDTQSGQSPVVPFSSSGRWEDQGWERG